MFRDISQPRNYLRVRPVFVSRSELAPFFALSNVLHFSVQKIPIDAPLLAPTIRPTGWSQGPARVPSHSWNDACLPSSCVATASFAIADGQQPRVGGISCASEGTGLSIPRAATPRGHREAGPARGGPSHRKAEFIETPRFEDDCKAAGPRDRRAAPVLYSHERECNPDGIDAPLH